MNTSIATIITNTTTATSGSFPGLIPEPLERQLTASIATSLLSVPIVLLCFKLLYKVAMAKKTEHKYGTDKRGIERWLGRADRLWDPAYTSTEFGNAIAIMTEGFDIAVAKDDCLSGVLLSDVIDTSYFEAWGVYFRMQGGWLPCQLS